MARPSIRLDYNAPFTLTFALLCIVAFAIAWLTGYEANRYIFSIQYHPDWANAGTYVRLFTHVLGHATPEHLASNLLMILLLGPMLEEKYGWVTLLLTALCTALLTGLVMALILPGTLLGASGVAFAFIVLSSFTRFKAGTIPITFLLVAILFVGHEVAMALSDKGAADGIAQFAHILGGAVGAGVGWMKRA
ncbi:MAG: putative membrane protein [Puniceicoccaceae bacterium 5H]|nr:MAG: putative membrane protein [Puniceicoccaceae bacterium 5H]